MSLILARSCRPTVFVYQSAIGVNRTYRGHGRIGENDPKLSSWFSIQMAQEGGVRIRRDPLGDKVAPMPDLVASERGPSTHSESAPAFRGNDINGGGLRRRTSEDLR